MAGVEIIAEPGRYFAEAPFTLGCMVFGDREGRTPAGQPCYDYWITDGLYGAMNSLLYDHATLFVAPLHQPEHPDGGKQFVLSLISGSHFLPNFDCVPHFRLACFCQSLTVQRAHQS